MSLLKMQKNHDFDYHAKGGKLKLTNLSFVDDLLMFARGDKKSIKLMMSAFDNLFASMGLKVNPNKY